VPGGYRIHDYLDYNPSREAVQKRRDGERVVKQAGGRARAERGGRDLSGRFESPAAAPASDQQTVGVSAGEVSGSSTHASPSSIPAGQLALSASIAPAPSRSRTRTEEEKKSSHLDGVPAADARKATNPGIRVAIHAFAAAHRKHLGTPYVPNYGRDGKALKRLLTTYTLEQVLACLPLYFADEKSIERIGARIPLFVDRVPTLAARLGDRASEGDPSRTDLAETWERRWTKEGDPS
jgi:hypothetical protein